MSLYYEPDPANDDDPPLLPPILTPVVVPNNIDVFTKAIDLFDKLSKKIFLVSLYFLKVL